MVQSDQRKQNTTRGYMESDEFKLYASQRYFEHVRSLEMLSNAALAEIKRARDKLDIAGVSYENYGHGSPTDSKIPDGIANLYEVIDKVDSQMVEYSEEKNKAESVVDQVPDARYKCVLRCHYLNGLTWHQTAKVINYSKQHCFRLREPALMAAFPYIPYEWKTNLPKAEV